MSNTLHVKMLSIASIVVKRDDRQRREISVDDLKLSIAQHGVIVPIIVDDNFTLIAGERRLTACKALGLEEIPARLFSDLSEDEAQIIELEENLKRKALSWQEEVDSVNKIHQRYLAKDPTWTAQKTGRLLSLSDATMSNYLMVGKPETAPKIEKATTLSQAVNIVKKQQEREQANIISDVIASLKLPEKPVPGEAQSTPESLPAESILNVDFETWAASYSGPLFNFIHCDFPYGINAFGGDMSGRTSAETYDDSPDVYWNLIKVLAKNLPNLLADSGHLMFWFSMEYYPETLDVFAKLAPSLNFQKFPLIWMKSDNTGIVPDFRREGRRIYETAFIASQGDRHILSPVANAYAAPVDRLFHPSTKPEPMLRHFFRMFVDEHSRVLDPTCGSGSALRAAESMNAEFVLGLERSPEHFKNAQTALRQFRALRSIKK